MTEDEKVKKLLEYFWEVAALADELDMIIEV